MRLRRSLQAAVVSAALVSPLPAFAVFMGSVTTAPVGQPAPALAMPLLIALAIALIGLGAYSLRTRSAGAVAGFALVTGLSLLAGLGYANGGIVVQGADCNTQTTLSYPSLYGETLTSLCPNSIRIVAIDPGCENSDPPVSHCTVGQILTNGQECVLPSCI